MSLVWAKDDLVAPEIFTPGHAHSNFASHPLGTAAALATWRCMLEQDYETSVPAKGAYFLTGLKKLQECYDFVYTVDGLGLLLNIVFADEAGKPYKGSAQAAATIAQDNDFTWNGSSWRMILQTGGYDLNTFKLAPYLDISYEEIDRTVGILDQVFHKLGASLENSST